MEMINDAAHGGKGDVLTMLVHYASNAYGSGSRVMERFPDDIFHQPCT